MMKCFSHGGNIKEMAERFGLKECNIIDFSSNVNPLGLPSSVRKVIRDNIKNIFRYPDPKSSDLKRVLGKYLKVSDENIIVGNGSTELIYQIAYTFKPKVALMVLPTFSEYEKALTTVGTKIEYLRLEEKDEFRISIKEIVKKIHGVNMVFLCNPNNPTGQIVKREDMVLLLKKIETGKVIVVVDEAFILQVRPVFVLRKESRQIQCYSQKNQDRFFHMNSF